MMYDLLVAFAISIALSLVLFLLGSWIGRTRSIVESNVTALIAFGGLGIYLFYLRDSLLLATWLPVSGLIILGNWLPFWFNLLSGLAWSLIPRLNAKGNQDASSQPSIIATPIKSESSQPGISWGVGKENWSEEDLRILWRGRGMRLISRR